MITLGELLNMASMQDEYCIMCGSPYYYETYNNVDDIPAELNDHKVLSLYGYDANGYDGLEVTII